tara:strand:- start:460 stop:735 length:276 start_codon:yes stop_codon:yes gene_type:complete
MIKVGDMVEENLAYDGGVKYQGKVVDVHGGGLITVLWDHGSYTAESDLHESLVTKLSTANKFNFVIFKNYDGSTEGKLIPRKTYNRLMASS